MKTVFAEIITIGDEILFGQITDTNSQWISQQLDQFGIRVIRKSSVGDSKDQILKIFKESESRADIILITGGLGPTSDDITKKTMADYFQADLKLNETALKDVTEFFNKRGKELTDINKQQAYLPDNCVCIRNLCGTAPGMWFEKNEKVFVSMPGVPFEMKAMMTETILPRLKQKFQTPVIFHKIIHTVGIGESYLSEKINEWENKLPSHIKLAYLPSLGEVKLRLTGTGATEAVLKEEVESQTIELKKYIEDYIYGYDSHTLPKVIGQHLLEKNLTISAAESCTGGYISHLITSVPGSSNYYRGSILAYDNEVKKKLLGVKESTLAQQGAVSEQTVLEMAEGVRKSLGTDIGISSSGIAGPGGGTPEKPVGTIWIAYSDNKGAFAKKLMLGNDRDINIKYTAIGVLNLLRQTLLKNS